MARSLSGRNVTDYPEMQRPDPLKAVGELQAATAGIIREMDEQSNSANIPFMQTNLLFIAAQLSYYAEQIEQRFGNQNRLVREQDLRDVAHPYRLDRVVPTRLAGFLAFANAEMDRFEIPQLDGSGMGNAPDEEISVDIYVDGDDEGRINAVVSSVQAMLKAMGYEETGEPEVQRGSIFRRSRAVANQGIDELKNRLMKVERGFELAQLDFRQAEVNSKEAEAASSLLASLEGVSRACVRVGSLLIVKFMLGSEQVVLVRTLTQVEMHALGRFPEIQRNPEEALEMLATAIANMPDGDPLPMSENGAIE